jgi:hypothetical protein
MLDRIEGVVKGTFKGGGHIEQTDGQLLVYYLSHLKDPDPEALVRGCQVIAVTSGSTVIEVKRKEYRMMWGEALLRGLTI